jgi:hypothetical protein
MALSKREMNIVERKALEVSLGHVQLRLARIEGEKDTLESILEDFRKRLECLTKEAEEAQAEVVATEDVLAKVGQAGVAR